jgi:hypothetical protein
MLEADATLRRCGTDVIQEDPLENCERLRRNSSNLPARWPRTYNSSPLRRIGVVG